MRYYTGMGNQRYEQEQKRLAALPRAQRFEELLEFPCPHAFKVIGDPDGLARRVMDVMAANGHPDATPMERSSSKGRWLSVTVEVTVQSGQELDDLYSALEKLDGVKYLF